METSNRKRGARSGWERRRELGAPAAYARHAASVSAGAGVTAVEPSRAAAPDRPIIWYRD